MCKRFLFSLGILLLGLSASDAQQPVLALPLAEQGIFSASFATGDSLTPLFGDLAGGEAVPAVWLDIVDDSPDPVRQTAAIQASPLMPRLDFAGDQGVNPRSFAGSFASRPGRFDVGSDFYSAPEFDDGLIVFGPDVAMKIGGYVKADFIYDFNPIESTDSFDTTTIPIGAADRTNFRAHGRQTRLSFDTRWRSEGRVVQVFVEGDFFSDNDQFRLRHAYGEVDSLLVGRTWTTFTDVTAAPATLDFEGSVSNVNRRQAQARWTQQIIPGFLTMAVAVEDARFIIVPPPSVSGETRSPSPDFIARLRLERDWGKFQIAGLYRKGGFQPDGEDVQTGNAWGLNFTGVVLLLESTKAYYQILFGEGISSYRGLPDAAPASATTLEVLPLFGWMVGVTHDWNDNLNSNFTYAANSLENAPLQSADDVRETSYMAANLIWSPVSRVKVGVEYLYGHRENVDRTRADAHRIQTAFIFELP